MLRSQGITHYWTGGKKERGQGTDRFYFPLSPKRVPISSSAFKSPCDGTNRSFHCGWKFRRRGRFEGWIIWHIIRMINLWGKRHFQSSVLNWKAYWQCAMRNDTMMVHSIINDAIDCHTTRWQMCSSIVNEYLMPFKYKLKLRPAE